MPGKFKIQRPHIRQNCYFFDYIELKKIKLIVNLMLVSLYNLS